MNSLEQFGTIPIDSAALSTILTDYKSVNNKIAAMEKSGTLIRLKKGLFVVSSKESNQVISRELIANHLYGPSYVSLESALSFYGLIPEKVYAVRSVTTKKTKNFSTPIGNFDYTIVPDNYFQIGIQQKVVDDKYAFLIASPEKAICDMIVTTHGLRLQSVKAVQVYLEEDLRIDFSVIDAYDTNIIKLCIAAGRKKTELIQLLKFLEQ